MAVRRQHLLIAALVSGLLTLPLALLIAPADAVQGNAQRLMYLHVPVAWCAYLCFTVVLLASLRQLFCRGGTARSLARAASEVGVVLTLLTLATGSIWGAATWGTWWAWDARIITTLGMGLVYIAYLALDGLATGRAGSRFLAVIGIAGFLTVPLVHFSVLWWRTLHQPPTLLAPSLSPPIAPLMGAALAAAVLTFTLVTAWAVCWRRAMGRHSSGGAAAVDVHQSSGDEALSESASGAPLPHRRPIRAERSVEESSAGREAIGS